MMVQYALDKLDKAARRAAILAAARALFLRDPQKLPSSAMIAAAAGLAKGTVYLYFRTKEEIFMALLREERQSLLDQVLRAFPVDGKPATGKIESFLREYVAYTMAHPEMLRLDALGYSVLERNLGLELLKSYKLEFAEALTPVAEAVEASLGLPEGRGVRLLMHTYALTLGLWQSLDLSEACRSIMHDSALHLMRLDFENELRDALDQYWRGL